MRLNCSNNKRTAGIIRTIGAVAAVAAFFSTVMSGMLVFKFIRYLNTAQRALPKMQKAAEVYMENSKKQDHCTQQDEGMIQ
ncbi:MAG TPA: hypothetical protein VHO71_04470 [Caproiciproducens sp.]|nr:hypothetical protein [Caproiciproducens sp.]